MKHSTSSLSPAHPLSADQHVAAACPQLRSLVKLDLAGNSSGSKVGDLTCQAIAGVGADEGAGLVRLCELSLRSCSVTARCVCGSD